jgi:hypothetical protein
MAEVAVSIEFDVLNEYAALLQAVRQLERRARSGGRGTCRCFDSHTRSIWVARAKFWTLASCNLLESLPSPVHLLAMGRRTCSCRHSFARLGHQLWSGRGEGCHDHSIGK